LQKASAAIFAASSLPPSASSDITGSSLFHAATGEFVYSHGPIFANIVLADEINRTTPRTNPPCLKQ